MLVIDPYKPKTDLLERYSNIFIEKGITQVKYEEFKQIMDKLLGE